VVPELSPSERKIIELYGKFVPLQNTHELKAAADELKAAIHQHLEDAKEKWPIWRLLFHWQMNAQKPPTSWPVQNPKGFVEA
jgi:hypothetical protein